MENKSIYYKKLLAALGIVFFALPVLLTCFWAGAESAEGDAELQLRLKELGFLSASSGAEDEGELQRAIYNFQKANGIPANGISDPTTRQRLISGEAVSFSEYIENYLRPVDTDISLSFRDSGRTVRRLQEELNALGYYIGDINGDYNMETACAVALFETVNGLEPDGLADSLMLGRLLSPSAIALNGFEDMEVLSFGDRGVNVKYVQSILKGLGYFDGECSGSFGERTRKAVIAFEQRNNIEPTGSWTILYTVMSKNSRAVSLSGASAAETGITLKLGDSGYMVQSLKSRLSELGYYGGEINDLFDERTRFAVMAFQEANGLKLSGEADDETRSEMNKSDCVTNGEFALKSETAALSYGQTSYGVYLMTRRLQALSYPVEAQWDFGDDVLRAVTVFKYAQGFDASFNVSEEERRLMNSQSALSYAEASRIANEKQKQIDLQDRISEILFDVKSAIGSQYKAGQTGAEGFGIGGLTYWCYTRAGLEMQPTGAMQLESAQQSGVFTEFTNELTPGSQLFFKDAEGVLYTGVYTDENTVIYASPSEGKVIEAALEDISKAFELIGSANYLYEG